MSNIANTDEHINELTRLLDTKEELHPDLQMFISDGPMGPMLRHPLVFSLMHTPDRNALMNRSYKAKTEAVIKAKADKEWNLFIFLHEKPYRVDAFINIRPHVHGKEYWDLVGRIWTDSENIWQNQRIWKMIWSSKEPDREAAMDEDELNRFRGLPDPIVIYRGVHLKSAYRGFSWTIDREKAIWFAKRYRAKDKKSILLESVIPKNKALAYFSRESEVVVNPSIIPRLKFEEHIL